jgi:hypothetical protein
MTNGENGGKKRTYMVVQMGSWSIYTASTLWSYLGFDRALSSRPALLTTMAPSCRLVRATININGNAITASGR